MARWVVPVSGGGGGSGLASDRNPSYLMMPLAQRRLRGLKLLEHGLFQELDPPPVWPSQKFLKDGDFAKLWVRGSWPELLTLNPLKLAVIDQASWRAREASGLYCVVPSTQHKERPPERWVYPSPLLVGGQVPGTVPGAWGGGFEARIWQACCKPLLSTLGDEWPAKPRRGPPRLSSRGRQERGGGTYPAGCDRAGCSGRSVGARACACG